MKQHRQECLCHSIAALMLLAGCAQPPREERAAADPTAEPAYAQAVQQLAALNRQAEDLLKRDQPDAAADAIAKGQPIQARLLAAPRPTLAAMEAASDLDDLYARMLLLHHHDGWARMTFERNVARWRIWKPQTEDTKRRLRQAQAGVAECDRRMGQ